MEEWVIGRDWYDLEQYIKKGIPLDLRHFALRAKDTGDWTKEDLTQEDVLELLRVKFKTVSFDNVQEDVIPFIKDDKVLEIWGEQYFNDLLEKLKFQSGLKAEKIWNLKSFQHVINKKQSGFVQ